MWCVRYALGEYKNVFVEERREEGGGSGSGMEMFVRREDTRGRGVVTVIKRNRAVDYGQIR